MLQHLNVSYKRIKLVAYTHYISNDRINYGARQIFSWYRTMIVDIEHRSMDQTSVFFGVNDFTTDSQTSSSNVVSLWLNRKVKAVDTNFREHKIHGDVAFATEEATKIDIDLIDMIADYSSYDNTHVIIGLSEDFGSTITAVRTLMDDDDVDMSGVEFIGDKSLIK